jgi:hypothetical protein
MYLFTPTGPNPQVESGSRFGLVRRVSSRFTKRKQRDPHLKAVLPKIFSRAPSIASVARNLVPEEGVTNSVISGVRVESYVQKMGLVRLSATCRGFYV